MVGPAVAVKRVAMTGPHDLHAQLGRTLQGGVEVIYLKPEEHTIAVGSVRAIADGTVIMLHIEAVQLQDELAILHQLLVVAAAVSAAAAEQLLIPPAAGFDVRDADKGLGTHGDTVTRLGPALLHPVANRDQRRHQRRAPGRDERCCEGDDRDDGGGIDTFSTPSF